MFVMEVIGMMQATQGMFKMGNKFVRKALELLIDKAETQEDFDLIKYTIDDYLEEGYRIRSILHKYNTKYKEVINSK